VAVIAAEDKAETGLDPFLTEHLVCPVDHHDLRLEENRLVCTECGRVYPIEDGIPNMLPENAP